MNDSEKQKISGLEEIPFTGTTKIPAYDTVSNKTGYLSALNLITKNLYCGCRWRRDSASCEGEPEGDLDLLKELPSVLGLGGYLVQNDHSRRKLAADTHYRFKEGGEAKLDGSMGHYMWGWGIQWYLSVFSDSTYDYIRIGLNPISGAYNYTIPIASRDAAGCSALDRTNNILVAYINSSAQYRGCSNDASLDSAFNSMLGRPATKIAEDAFETYAEKNGARWSASHTFINFVTACICCVIFHNRNIQAGYNATLTDAGLHQGGLGAGCDWKGDADNFGHYGWVPRSVGAELGDFLGTFSYTANNGVKDIVTGNIPCFFGLKNWYHNLWCMLHGVILNGTGTQHDVYVQKLWGSAKIETSDYSKLEKIGSYPNVDSNNWYYAMRMVMKNLVFYPDTLGASGSTGFGDGQFLEASTVSGVRGLLALAGADNGGDAGSFALNANFAPSLASVNCGAFLGEAAADWNAEPTWVD